ncbi:hypothetical protein DLAC_02153 [Tieghemostelium lacteum]|uniref:N-acetyltransferase domain-containing protein n=1 Tax=Tieghemostelium lacteum TaxID=361077 RepID=A0A152A4B4_TIELA|nr:hypothetical protein DLAC_02153 [Tieghemostelium lacteum]|eukprot:KYR01059.1 hypothetical protein DLAC_02153 [Tieghemostelium lacteum]
MIKIIKCDSENIDFKNLIIELDKSLAITDGAEMHDFYHQFNVGKYENCLVAYLDGVPVGSGAIKSLGEEYKNTAVEIKRMYVLPMYRRKGIAQQVLATLEQWAKELGFSYAQLETGINQTDAIALYKKLNYYVIPNYGQYIGVTESVCLKKDL